MDWRGIDPRKEPRRFSAIVLAGAAIGGILGGDLFRLIYDLLGWPWSGR